MSAPILRGRHSTVPTPGTVVFIIGMRINQLRRLRTWVPVMLAMPRMLAELGQRPELGLLGAKTYVSGRTVATIQYWRDAESLTRYATGRDMAHLPAWREFNRRTRDTGQVGIFHETYVIGRAESVYVNVPEDFGLGGVSGWVDPSAVGQSAAHRLDPAAADRPATGPDQDLNPP